MTEQPYPKVPEHLIQEIRDEYRQQWGYDCRWETARLWAIQRDHKRILSARDAGVKPEPSGIEYADPNEESYTLVDRVWAPDMRD